MHTIIRACIKTKLICICLLGEGTHALIDVPANTVFALYGGLLMTEYQADLRIVDHEKRRKENKWGRNYILQLEQWKNL